MAPKVSKKAKEKTNEEAQNDTPVTLFTRSQPSKAIELEGCSFSFLLDGKNTAITNPVTDSNLKLLSVAGLLGLNDTVQLKKLLVRQRVFENIEQFLKSKSHNFRAGADINTTQMKVKDLNDISRNPKFLSRIVKIKEMKAPIIWDQSTADELRKDGLNLTPGVYGIWNHILTTEKLIQALPEIFPKSNRKLQGLPDQVDDDYPFFDPDELLQAFCLLKLAITRNIWLWLQQPEKRQDTTELEKHKFPAWKCAWHSSKPSQPDPIDYVSGNTKQHIKSLTRGDDDDNGVNKILAYEENLSSETPSWLSEFHRRLQQADTDKDKDINATFVSEGKTVAALTKSSGGTPNIRSLDWSKAATHRIVKAFIEMIRSNFNDGMPGYLEPTRVDKEEADESVAEKLDPIAKSWLSREGSEPSADADQGDDDELIDPAKEANILKCMQLVTYREALEKYFASDENRLQFGDFKIAPEQLVAAATAIKMFEGDEFAGVFLALGCGLGKTLAALLIVDLYSRNRAEGRPPYKPTLIVVPPHLLSQWHREFSRGSFNDRLQIFVLGSHKVASKVAMTSVTTINGRQLLDGLYLSGGEFDSSLASTTKKFVLLSNRVLSNQFLVPKSMFDELYFNATNFVTSGSCKMSEFNDFFVNCKAEVDRIINIERKKLYLIGRYRLDKGAHLIAKSRPKKGSVNSKDSDVTVKSSSTGITLIESTGSDVSIFTQRFGLVLVDEAQCLKSRSSQINQSIRSLDADFTVLISATPYVNRAIDLIAGHEIIAKDPSFLPWQRLGISGDMYTDGLGFSLSKTIYDLVFGPNKVPNIPAYVTCHPVVLRALMNDDNSMAVSFAHDVFPTVQKLTHISLKIGDAIDLGNGQVSIIGEKIPGFRASAIFMMPRQKTRQDLQERFQKLIPLYARVGSGGDDVPSFSSALDPNAGGNVNFTVARHLSLDAFTPNLASIADWLTEKSGSGDILQTITQKDDHGASILFRLLVEDDAIDTDNISKDPKAAIRYLIFRSPKLAGLLPVLYTICIQKKKKAIITVEWPIAAWVTEIFCFAFGLSPLYIHSDTPTDRRIEIQDAFNDVEDKHMVLISTDRLIGTGTNLHAACCTMIRLEEFLHVGVGIQVFGRVTRNGQQFEQRIIHIRTLCCFEPKRMLANAFKWAPFQAGTIQNVGTPRELQWMTMLATARQMGLTVQQAHKYFSDIERTHADCGVDNNNTGDLLTRDQRLDNFERFLNVQALYHHGTEFDHHLLDREKRKLREEKERDETSKEALKARLRAHLCGPPDAAVDQLLEPSLRQSARGKKTKTPKTGKDRQDTSEHDTPDATPSRLSKSTSRRLDSLSRAKVPQCWPSRIIRQGTDRLQDNGVCRSCGDFNLTTAHCFEPCVKHESEAKLLLFNTVKLLLGDEFEVSTGTVIQVVTQEIDEEMKNAILDGFLQQLPKIANGCDICHPPSPNSDDEDESPSGAGDTRTTVTPIREHPSLTSDGAKRKLEFTDAENPQKKTKVHNRDYKGKGKKRAEKSSSDTNMTDDTLSTNGQSSPASGSLMAKAKERLQAFEEATASASVQHSDKDTDSKIGEGKNVDDKNEEGKNGEEEKGKEDAANTHSSEPPEEDEPTRLAKIELAAIELQRTKLLKTPSSKRNKQWQSKKDDLDSRAEEMNEVIASRQNGSVGH